MDVVYLPFGDGLMTDKQTTTSKSFIKSVEFLFLVIPTDWMIGKVRDTIYGDIHPCVHNNFPYRDVITQ